MVYSAMPSFEQDRWEGHYGGRALITCRRKGAKGSPGKGAKSLKGATRLRRRTGAGRRKLEKGKKGREGKRCCLKAGGRWL